MKNFYKKHVNWIVIFLLAFSLFKGCQSCSRGNQLKWQESSHKHVVDSLNSNIDMYKGWNDSLANIIKIYSVELENMKSTNELLVNTNKTQQETNKALVNTNKKLMNK